MRRVWVKKADIFHKPFYKQKLKMTLVLVILMAVVFFSYQIFCMNQLNKTMLFFDTGSGSGSGGANPSRHNNNVHFKRFQSVAVSIHKNLSHSSTTLPLLHGPLALIRGVHPDQMVHYYPNRNRFKCISTGAEIHYDKVNDDFCDCPEDGSDEPSTNACAKGQFHCTSSMMAIPSSRINDRVCDCCDLSDEWLRTSEVKCRTDCR